MAGKTCRYCGKNFLPEALRQTVYGHEQMCLENPARLVFRCETCHCDLRDRTSVRRHNESSKHMLMEQLRSKHIMREQLPNIAGDDNKKIIPQKELGYELFGKKLVDTGPYQVIYADPPWQYRRAAGQGVACHHYPTMSDEEIASMPVQALAATNCALLMWATSPKLPDAIRVVQQWGFVYKTVFFTWIKTDKDGKPLCGLGSYTRSSTEICLLGVKGNVMPWKQSSAVQQTILSPRREHSRKPEEARRRIEEFFGNNISRIELFAREQGFEGWQVWGNDTSKFSPC